MASRFACIELHVETLTLIWPQASTRAPLTGSSYKRKRSLDPRSQKSCVISPSLFKTLRIRPPWGYYTKDLPPMQKHTVNRHEYRRGAALSDCAVLIGSSEEYAFKVSDCVCDDRCSYFWPASAQG